MLKFTPEQGDILDFIPELDGTLLVHAGAGTGKSFMSEQITRQLKPKTGLYTAFNKAIVTEGVKRFKGTNMECKTMHSLAYKYVRPGKIDDLTYTCITENVTYHVKAQIIKAIDMFFVSASVDMYEFFADFFKLEKGSDKLVALSAKYVDKMVASELPCTFNFMLKLLHIMLAEEEIDCSYDLVILDEINDVTAVVLEIFKLIKSPKKLGLGETNQAIYKFLNLVDGFEELEDAPVMNLTQSFRCSTSIAMKIQSFMRAEVRDDFTFIGTDDPVMNGKYLYCTMTNSMIIDEICMRLTAGKGFKLLRTPADIFACPMALMTVSNGKRPYQKKYRFLMDEYDYWREQPSGSGGFLAYILEHVEDHEIQNAVKLLLGFKRRGINLFDIYRRAKSARVDEDYTIATVFTSKGLEYQTVTIADDLNTAIQKIRDKGGIADEDDLVVYRCAYVACSRAGKSLINAKFLSV